MNYKSQLTVLFLTFFFMILLFEHFLITATNDFLNTIKPTQQRQWSKKYVTVSRLDTFSTYFKKFEDSVDVFNGY